MYKKNRRIMEGSEQPAGFAIFHKFSALRFELQMFAHRAEVTPALFSVAPRYERRKTPVSYRAAFDRR